MIRASFESAGSGMEHTGQGGFLEKGRLLRRLFS